MFAKRTCLEFFTPCYAVPCTAHQAFTETKIFFPQFDILIDKTDPLRLPGVPSLPTWRHRGPRGQSEPPVRGWLQPPGLLPVAVRGPVLADRAHPQPGADQPDGRELHLPGCRARLPIYQPEQPGEAERTTKDHCQPGNSVQVRFILEDSVWNINISLSPQ